MNTITIFWLQGQSCSGCSISLLQSTYPSIEELLPTPLIKELKLELGFHTLISFANVVEADLQELFEERDFILIVEGSIPTKNSEHGLLDEVKHIRELAPRALATVAVGTCASFGGIPSAKPNPTGASGLLEVVGKGYRSKLGVPVINVPGCPPHPDWIIGTIADVFSYVIYKTTLELDEFNRPKRFYSRTIHNSCPKAGFFGENVFAKKFGEQGCLLLLGCKGPVTCGDCGERKWHSGISACPISGSVCIGCTEPGFPDNFAPFICYPPKPVPAIIPPPALILYLYGLHDFETLLKLLKKRAE